MLSLVAQSCPTLCDPMDCSQAPLSIEFSSQEDWSGLPCPLPGVLPNQGIEPRSPVLKMDSLPSEPPGKLKNTGVGSLSILQGTFPTQELNQRLLHCGGILYQLSYQGSPIFHYISSVQFSHSVMSDSLRPPESQHARPPCASPTPGVHSDSCPSSQ